MTTSSKELYEIYVTKSFLPSKILFLVSSHIKRMLKKIVNANTQKPVSFKCFEKPAQFVQFFFQRTIIVNRFLIIE